MITHKIKSLTFNNTYTLTKRNVMTGEEEAHEFHNVILNRFAYCIRADAALFERCYLGSGSGEPSASDTGLFHSLFYNPNKPTYSSKKIGDKKEFTYYYVFPASSSYVGTITEVGLYNTRGQSGFVTHALVTDSEGNPISIEKTAIDEVIVTVKISVERPNFSSGQTWAFDLGWLRDGYTFGIDGSFLNRYFYNGFYGAKLNYDWAPDLSSDGNAKPSSETISSNETSRKVSCTFEWDSQVSFVGFVNSIIVGKSRIAAAGGDGGSAFRLLFPNSSVFPIRHLTNLSLGTGDGETTDFVPEIPMWVKDTEVVYKDGVALVRGVDYLADSASNLEKVTSYGLGNFICGYENKISFPPDGRYNAKVFGLRNSVGNESEFCGPILAVNHEFPIVFEYARDFAFTTKVNSLRVGDWSRIGTTSLNWPSGTALVFEVSSDGALFEEVHRSVFSSSAGRFSDTNYHKIKEMTSVKFLRIRMELPSGTNSDSYKNQGLYCNSDDTYFGYIGEYAIRFVNPPEAGSVLTIDLSIDRPYKSANNIIQYNPEFNF